MLSLQNGLSLTSCLVQVPVGRPPLLTTEKWGVYPGSLSGCRSAWRGLFGTEDSTQKYQTVLGQPALHWDARLFADKLHPGSLPRSFSVCLVDNVSLSATSAREGFGAKSLTDVEWWSDVHCIPSSAKGSGEPGWQCCQPAQKNRRAVDMCGCAGCSWVLTALVGPRRFGEVVLIFYLNPRAEQNLRNGREGDKMS